MDPIIDKRAELAYLMTLRDQAILLHQRLIAMNESVQFLQKESYGMSLSRADSTQLGSLDSLQVLHGWKAIFGLSNKIYQCSRSGSPAVFVKVKL
jgi:hypothetical protein